MNDQDQFELSTNIPNDYNFDSDSQNEFDYEDANFDEPTTNHKGFKPT